MNYSHAVFFFENYSLTTILISAIVFAVTVISEQIFSEKIPSAIKTFAPFALGVIFNVLYNALFTRVAFTEDVIVSGILCGSVSGVFSSFYYRIKEGKFYLDDAGFLSVENTVKNTVGKDKKEEVTQKIRVILSDDSLKREEKKELVALLLIENAVSELPQKQARQIAELILEQEESLKR